MRGSLNVLGAVEAFRRGYRVLKNGDLVSPLKRVLSRKNVNSNGYQQFSLPWKNRAGTKKKFVNVLAHHLLVYQKYGEEALKSGVQVRHLNENRTDNSWDNIAVGSQSDNMMDRPPEKRIRIAKLAASRLRALSLEEAQQLIDDRAAGSTYRTLRVKYCVSKSTVSYLINGKTYPELIR